MSFTNWLLGLLLMSALPMWLVLYRDSSIPTWYNNIFLSSIKSLKNFVLRTSIFVRILMISSPGTSHSDTRSSVFQTYVLIFDVRQGFTFKKYVDFIFNMATATELTGLLFQRVALKATQFNQYGQHSTLKLRKDAPVRPG